MDDADTIETTGEQIVNISSGARWRRVGIRLGLAAGIETLAVMGVLSPIGAGAAPSATSTAGIATALHSPRYMRKHCPIEVSVNFGAGHRVGSGSGVSVGSSSTHVTVNGVPNQYAVRYHWRLSKHDQFCGIVGVWYGPRPKTLVPTTETAHSGTYIDTSVEDPNNSLAGFIVYAQPAGRTAADAARRPTTPSQARNQITTYFNRIYYGLIDVGTMKVQTETLRPERLVITGDCTPPHNGGFLRIDDSEANGQTIVKCQVYQGRHVTSHMPRNRMPYTTQEHVTYVPVLTSLGERAATSVGLTDTQHGTATYAFDSATDLDISYARNPAATATKQLQELKLHVSRGHESVREIWYG